MGYRQQFGLEFDERFSPIIKPAIVCIILSLVVQFHLSLRQFDVTNAFLLRVLKEEVYMTQLPSFVDLTTLIILVNFINPKMVSSKHPMLGLSVSPLIFKLMVSMDLLLTPVIIHPLQWSLHQSITLLLTGNDISFIDNLIHQLGSFRYICSPAKLCLQSLKTS